MTVAELCNQVLVYLQTIDIQNKTGKYTPSGSVVNGAEVGRRTFGVRHCPSFHKGVNYSKVTNVVHAVRTNESIPSQYLQQASNERIKNDWINFKNNYISKILKMNETISISSMFVFIYLVRCFINTRFALFTDVYHNSYVWLYNTNTSVDYQVNGNIVPAEYHDMSGVAVLKQIAGAIADDAANRNYVHVLKARVVKL